MPILDEALTGNIRLIVVQKRNKITVDAIGNESVIIKSTKILVNKIKRQSYTRCALGKFMFEFPTAPLFYTFTLNPESKIWRIIVEQKGEVGKWRIFADQEINKAKREIFG